MENQPESQFQNFGGKLLLNTLSEVERVAFYKKTYAYVAGGVLVLTTCQQL